MKRQKLRALFEQKAYLAWFILDGCAPKAIPYNVNLKLSKVEENQDLENLLIRLGFSWLCNRDVFCRLRNGTILQYKSRGRGFESYSGHFHSHKLSQLRLCLKLNWIENVFEMEIELVFRIDLLHNYVSSLEIHIETTIASTWWVAKSQSIHCVQTHQGIPLFARSNARFGN